VAFTITTRTSQETSDVTSHNVLLPDGSDVSGRRVLIVIGVDGAPSITWPMGWTEFAAGSTTQTQLSAAYRDIDGTEGFDGTDDEIVFTTSGGGEQSNHQSYLISEGHDAATAPEAATAATGGSATPDPPSLNPSGWGTEETLWIAAAALRFNDTWLSAPTNYTDLLAQSGGDANAPLATARRVLEAESEDPGSFTINDGSSWVATTIGVRPAAGGVTEPYGRVTETETARELVASKAAVFGRAVEAAVVRGFATIRDYATSRATETETARAFTTDKSAAVGRIVELETARAFGLARAYGLGRATETETIRPFDIGKSAAVGRASETETARAFGTTFGAVYGRVVETETVHGFAAARAADFSRAAEVEAARAFAAVLGHTYGRVTESETARGFVAAKTAAFGRAVETETVRVFSAAGIADPNPFTFTHQEPAQFTYTESAAFTFQEPT
jgi:hypothetical protein